MIGLEQDYLNRFVKFSETLREAGKTHVKSPITSRNIKIGGGAYKKIINSGVQNINIDGRYVQVVEKSQKIHKDKGITHVINPITGRKVKVGSASYKRMMKSMYNKNKYQQRRQYVKAFPIKQKEEAFRATVSYEIVNNKNLKGESSYKILYAGEKMISKARETYGEFTFNYNVMCRFKRVENGEVIEEIVELGIQLNKKRCLAGDNIKNLINECIQQLNDKIFDDDAVTNKLRGSGFIFVDISSAILNIVKTRMHGGKSYIPLPQWIQNKACCINIKNEDDKCFIYSYLYHINRHNEKFKSHPERQSKYKKVIKDIDLSNIKFPVTLDQIPRIEKMFNISINIFEISKDNKNINPLIITKHKYPDMMDLLLLKGEGFNHYVYVKDFNKLKSANTMRDGKHVSNTHHYCRYCGHGFYKKELLEKHADRCSELEPSRVVLPRKGQYTQFNNYKNKYRCPFIVYADFEALTTETTDDKTKKTQKYQNHVPCGYAFQVVSSYQQHKFEIDLYRGEDAVYRFIESLLKVGDKLVEIIKTNVEMKLTNEEQKSFNKARICHICGDVLGTDKVRDHDHISGEYRGASHNSCNINLNNKNLKIPVVFHNLKNYDGHFIIKELSRFNFKNIGLIAQNFEKYMTFNFGCFKFIDSCSFLPASLDTLVSSMDESKLLYTMGQNLTDEQKKLLLRKGVYPYDYMNSFTKLLETRLPQIDDFYSKLNNEHISKDDYEHAVKVWIAFMCKDMGDYHDLYLKTDVLLLADVFENFRNISMTNYGLDPAYYISTPAFGWDCMMKLTKIKLYQLHDIDMYLMIEKGIRGGISVIAHRYAKANNKYMKNYLDDVVSSYITYLDANNLYGNAMVEKMPCDDFKWEDVDRFYDIQNVNSSDDRGYILEVDLEYPENLHDLHNEYPLAPENIKITKNMLSPYCKDLLNKLDTRHVSTSKLTPNLMNKTKYVLHIENLKYYVSKGLIINKIHRVISFKQCDFLKQYVDFNTSMRAKAKNSFEKDYFKLMVNAVFGKTMENVRNHRDIKLVTNEKHLVRNCSKPNYHTHQIYDKNLVAIELLKTETTLNKPIYVGMTILDLSKIHMYKFHYDYIKKNYGDNAKLLFTDTDSLTYHIQTNDLYEDFNKNKSIFDFSDMPKDHKCYDETNKKVLGKFKPEELGKIITEFVGLRSKMYSILFDDNKYKSTGKGIKKSALKKEISHNDYFRCLNSEKVEDQRQSIEFNLIRSNKHNLSSIKINKVSLCSVDDKRYLTDNVHSLAYGHKNISTL
jgi:hypothetical protein